MGDRFDRVTFTNGKRVIIRNLTTTVRGKVTVLRGFCVNEDREEPEPRNLHIFTSADVKRVTPLRTNLKYDVLEATTDDMRMPFHPDRGDGRATR